MLMQVLEETRTAPHVEPEESQELRGLTLTEPWASLIWIAAFWSDLGKHVETRSRDFTGGYRGRIAIHSGKTFPGWARDSWEDSENFQTALGQLGVWTRADLNRLPLQAVIATARLANVMPTLETFNGTQEPEIYLRPERGSTEFAFGNYDYGRYMYFLRDIRPLRHPVFMTGALGLWRIREPSTTALIRSVEIHDPSIISDPRELWRQGYDGKKRE